MQAEVEVGVGNVEAALLGLDVPQVAVPRPPQAADALDELAELGRVVPLALGGRDARDDADAVADEAGEGALEGRVRLLEVGVGDADEGALELGAVPGRRGGEVPLLLVREWVALEDADEEVERDDAELCGLGRGRGVGERGGPLCDEAVALAGDVVDAVADELAVEREVGGAEEALLGRRVDVVWVDRGVAEEEVGEGQGAPAGWVCRVDKVEGRVGEGRVGRGRQRFELVGAGPRAQDKGLRLEVLVGALPRRQRLRSRCGGRRGWGSRRGGGGEAGESQREGVGWAGAWCCECTAGEHGWLAGWLAGELVW